MKRILILFLFTFSSSSFAVAGQWVIVNVTGFPPTNEIFGWESHAYNYAENICGRGLSWGNSAYFCPNASPEMIFTLEEVVICDDGVPWDQVTNTCIIPVNYCDSQSVLDQIQNDNDSCSLKAAAIGSRYEVGKTCIENLDDHTKGSLTTSCTLLDEPYCGSSEYSTDVKTAYDACFASGDVQYFSHMCDAPTRTMTPNCKLADAPETVTPTTPTSGTDYNNSFDDNTGNLVGGTIDGSEVEQDFPTDTNGGGTTAPAIGSPEHQDAVCRQRFSASVCDDKINNTADGSTVTNPDAAPGDAISEKLATDVLNGISNHYESSTKEVLGDFADSFTSLEKSTPLGGDKLDSFVAAYKSLFPSSSSCTPLTISLPLKNFTITCEFSDKFKTIFAFIIYFYTIQSLIGIVFSSIKPKPVS